jgi:hypothetical protein
MDSKKIDIKTAWEQFLRKKNLTQTNYLNISKAKSTKQLKKIVGIELGIRKALDEVNVILSEEEIQKLTEKVLEKTTFEKEHDPRTFFSYEKASYYNHEVTTMMRKYPWYAVTREYRNWEIVFDDNNSSELVRREIMSGKTIDIILNLIDDGF